MKLRGKRGKSRRTKASTSISANKSSSDMSKYPRRTGGVTACEARSSTMGTELNGSWLGVATEDRFLEEQELDSNC